MLLPSIPHSFFIGF